MAIPDNLAGLHIQEEHLREKALGIVDSEDTLKLHLNIVEHAMDLADKFRQFDTEDEDLKVVQVLGMRIFNAFGASLKLVLTGYHQNGTLVMRDILETTFLLDLFRGNRNLITRWRLSDKKKRWKEFSPVKVREALDSRDGHGTKKRAEHYALFSDLAGHPSMSSVFMMRPRKAGDAVIGPFIEKTTLEATLSEMGKLAVLAGEQLNDFFPQTWRDGIAVSQAFANQKTVWMRHFFPR